MVNRPNSTRPAALRTSAQCDGQCAGAVVLAGVGAVPVFHEGQLTGGAPVLAGSTDHRQWFDRGIGRPGPES